MTDVTYTDIVDAQVRAAREGKTLGHLVLDSDAFESLSENLETRDDDPPDDIGSVQNFGVYKGDGNVLVTEDGTEYEL